MEIKPASLNFCKIGIPSLGINSDDFEKKNKIPSCVITPSERVATKNQFLGSNNPWQSKGNIREHMETT